MKTLRHQNVVHLKHCFFSNNEKDELCVSLWPCAPFLFLTKMCRYLNLVMEYVPETIYRVVKHYNKTKRPIPMLYIKLYMYQGMLHSCSNAKCATQVFPSLPHPSVARSLAYIHEMGVCHRDIKPQNLLLDTNAHVVKLCDFGRQVVPSLFQLQFEPLAHILSAPSSLSKASPILPTSAAAIIARPS